MNIQQIIASTIMSIGLFGIFYALFLYEPKQMIKSQFMKKKKFISQDWKDIAVVISFIPIVISFVGEKLFGIIYSIFICTLIAAIMYSAIKMIIAKRDNE